MPSRQKLAGSLAAVPAVLAVTVMAAALALSRYGFDLVDESYFLSLVADPGANRDNGEIFLFGFLFHPLFAALGDDVAVLRAVSLLALTLTAGWMAHVVLGYVEGARNAYAGNAFGRSWGIVVVAASAVSAVATNVRVPNYRTVSQLGLMLVAVALVWAARGQAKQAGLLLGSAWWLAVVGRPTTGAAVLLVVPAVLLASRLFSARLLGGCVIGAGLAAGLTMAIARMTPAQTLTYLFRGYTQNELLGGHASIRGMLGVATPQLTGFVALGLPVLAGAVLVDIMLSRQPRLPTVLTAASVALFFVAVVLVVVASLRVPIDGDASVVLSMGLVIPVWALVLLGAHGRLRPTAITEDRRLVVVLALLGVAPFLASVGTNAPFTYTMSLASTFWVLAAVIVARRCSDSASSARRLALVTSGVCLSVPMALLAALVTQVGLGPSGGPTRPVTVAGGSLRLATADADVLDLLSTVGADAGVTERTPVVDLTGIGPGYRFQLGPHPAGRPFFFGIFPGAKKAASYSLSWESCDERALAWLIYADDNPWDVSAAFTRGAVNLNTDYERMATFSPTQGPSAWRSLQMQVLRPTPSVARKLGC